MFSLKWPDVHNWPRLIIANYVKCFNRDKKVEGVIRRGGGWLILIWCCTTSWPPPPHPTFGTYSCFNVRGSWLEGGLVLFSFSFLLFFWGFLYQWWRFSRVGHFKGRKEERKRDRTKEKELNRRFLFPRVLVMSNIGVLDFTVLQLHKNTCIEVTFSKGTGTPVRECLTSISPPPLSLWLTFNSIYVIFIWKVRILDIVT